jgi:hypothetical protein
LGQSLKSVVGLFGVVFLLAGCGVSFTADCKSAINTVIDAREDVNYLSGFSRVPCDWQVSRAEKGETLAAACDALEEKVRDLRIYCADNLQDALDKTLLAERQY